MDFIYETKILRQIQMNIEMKLGKKTRFNMQMSANFINIKRCTIESAKY